ncbi:MAG: DNA polymerase I, partial [Gammaproteobacteria bacterium]|nr:DNA polymerase I [Gammaproteobacteria bacterium]
LPKIQIIEDINIFQQLMASIKPKDTLYIDTETDSLDTLVAQLVGISMAINDGDIVYLPLAHHNGVNLKAAEVLSALKPILLRDDIKLIGQNLKYDINVFKNVAIDIPKINADTMLESYIYNSSLSRHDLGSLAKHYLHRDSQSYEDLTGKGAKQIPFAAVDIEKAALYSGEDIFLCRALHHFFQAHLQENEKKLLENIELPLVSILAKMERKGVMIDTELLSHQSIRLKHRLQELAEQAFKLAGEVFNLQSPKQLATIFYTKMHFPILAKTPSGQPSTAEEVLQNLAHDYELPALILEHRRLSKLVSTYLDALPKKVHPLSGRVHTSYNQAITATGRLSSSDPNLQNIPIRTQEGRNIRQAFIARPQHLLLTADYSQVELRIMAHLSQDSRLISAFHDNLDIHQATAAEIFDLDSAMVNSEMRRQAKAINFGLIYGMSAFGLAKQLGIGRTEAQIYIERYFARYPGVLNYMEETKRYAKQHGFVETLMGRRLYLNDIQSKNIPRQKAAERTAINAPMQGTAADLIKKAMIDIDQYLSLHPALRCSMLMQVHDELVFEVHQDDMSQVTPIIKQLMENTLSLNVPLIVNLGQGHNWDEAH